ncbi:MAG: hypothetical protein KME20_07445 [Kaiparowitsia implicata GSE-PSE-MK54-09C]|nr:hypothetical protein [Kaiparowitsia implicata GSE-PSE-MK54-09C]
MYRSSVSRAPKKPPLDGCGESVWVKDSQQVTF